MICLETFAGRLQNNSSRAPVVAGIPALNIQPKRLDYMPVKIIPIGTRFSKLTILSVAPPWIDSSGIRHSRSLCCCDCGNRKEILNASLKRGATTSCGCYHSKVTRSKAIHGYNREGNRHPLYDCWNSMLRRCQNPKNPAYHDYGGRGITVCKRWQTFKNFLEDMLYGYRRDLTIERIDNNKGYSKGNCKWETRKGQMLNRRNAHLLTFNGQTMNLSTWAEKIGVPYQVLSQRVGKLGWPVERALTTALTSRGSR